MYDDIVKYIPYGRENAISRDDLAIKVGCSDRIMRDLISKARKKTVIINIQNGSGIHVEFHQTRFRMHLFDTFDCFLK